MKRAAAGFLMRHDDRACSSGRLVGAQHGSAGRSAVQGYCLLSP